MQVQEGGPSALLLSRQNLPFVERDVATIEQIEKGGYVLRDAQGAQAVIIATGSEVGLALEAQALLAQENIPVRVVSMPSTSVFDRHRAEWRDSVIPAALPAISIEAGVTSGWYKYVGRQGGEVR